jgi:transcriptional regulator with XRE-family HTH domain
MTKKNQKAEMYSSDLLDNLMSEITPQEQKRTDQRMQLAARIDEARIKKGLKKKEFAELMGKKSSEISRWLSGTHNISSDTLFDIEEILKVSLVNISDVSPTVSVSFMATISSDEMLTPQQNITLYSESTPVSFIGGKC